MRRIAWVLGVLAVLAVMASATLAITVRSSPPASAARQWLHAYGVEVAVPASRWQREPPSSAIRYSADAVVRSPAVLDAGFCPSSQSSSRAFVGILPPAGGSVPQVLGHELATWTNAISGRAYGISGRVGSRVDVDVPVPAGPCAPTTAHLTLVGRSTRAGLVVLVLVRDVGQPGDLSAATAEEIVRSIRTDPQSFPQGATWLGGPV
ncbi:hypothetical protein P5P86_05410 [Nocardioides sp. BP30]|uniref:hypothetical protein n=1 Tax=Nocardioides sp. BP30 TaxID=3036374 RepID=UPI002468EF5D|nr:hypothetical protein [Nocardioides sp. BP30]WGL53263.1 hypothetical protein P5P86_05410 [Nocardioides sp. BP30]